MGQYTIQQIVDLLVARIDEQTARINKLNKVVIKQSELLKQHNTELIAVTKSLKTQKFINDRLIERTSRL